MAHMPETIILRKTEETKTGVTYGIAKVKTNADRIRAMSDEELAVMFFNYHFSFTCPEQGCHECKESCMDCWLDWLKKEVEE